MIHIAIICPEDFDKDQSYEDKGGVSEMSVFLH